MTTAELHKYLDSTEPLTLKQVKKVIGAIYIDAMRMSYKKDIKEWQRQWYIGEQNGFRIVLDLLEKVEIMEKENKFERLEKHLESLDKDTLIGLYLQKCFDIKAEIELKNREISNLEDKLAAKEKEVASNIIKRVKELSVFDFKTYEETGFARYTITDMALDNILKKYKGGTT